MAKKLIVGVLGLGIVVAGIAAFAAFTAQIVNLEAHVEKEIEVAAVKNCTPVGIDIVCEETDGNFGTVIPQVEYDKTIEVTLSRSFVDGQTQFEDVVFAVLWECKQFDDERDLVDNLTGVPVVDDDTVNPPIVGPGDGWPDCRVNPTRGLDHNGDGVVDANDLTNGLHADGDLDDYLRNYARIVPDIARCLEETKPAGLDPRTPEEKVVEVIGFGTIFKGSDLTKKCFYQVKLLAPPCEGEFNIYTDPLYDPNNPTKTIECHFAKPTSDPQTWEHFADIGDDFKIQVIEHSLATQ